MSMPNVSTLYQRLKKGAESGHEFARFMNLLLTAECQETGNIFTCIDDASGDVRGLDAFYRPDDDFKEYFITGFQYKFYSSTLNSKQKKSIEKSIAHAYNANRNIQEFILVLPEDLQKNGIEWLEGLRTEYGGQDGLSRPSKFALNYWGHTKIIELCLKHDHIGCQYFTELYPHWVGKFKLVKTDIDSSICAWESSEKNKRFFYRININNDETSKYTTDPVIDFQFANDTNEIILLHKVEIEHKFWTEFSTGRGISQEYLLNSIGIIDIELDFDKEFTEYILPHPLIFRAKEPLRFQIQLKNFHKCRNSKAQLKFKFYFNDGDIICPTPEFIMTTK